EQRLRPVPHRFVPEPVRWTAGECDLDVVEPERRVERADALDETRELAGDLLLAAEDMAVVLRELPEPEEAVQSSRGLVPVHQAELGKAQRQVGPERPHPSDQLHVSGTADRLQSAGLALEDQHSLAEDAPVSAPLPDRLRKDLRTSHLAVAL